MIQGLNIVMNGITIHGPMFDIHDNGVVNNYFTASTESKHMNVSEKQIKEILHTLLDSTDEEGKRIFTEKQWAAYLKTGAAKLQKAREKRKAKAQALQNK